MIRPTVLCTNVPDLVNRIAEERGIEIKDCDLKFSIDKGNNKLKAGINIIELESLEEPQNKSKRMKYSDGVAPSTHKSSSANTMQILANVEDIPESYENLKIIIENLPGLTELEVIQSHDLKIIALMTGIQQASASYPCPYCHWKSCYTKKGKKSSKKRATLRTFGSNKLNYENWVKKGSIKDHAKNHFNCNAMPLLNFDDKLRVIDKFPPPELHILTGIFNHMYEGMLADPELKNCAEKWAEKVGVTRRCCPSLSFVGNHCDRLLKKLNLLMETKPPRSVHKE